MMLFDIISNVVKAARFTKLDNGRTQLILTDGNSYTMSGSSPDFKDKLIIDVMCHHGTDDDVINYCNLVTNAVINYGINNHVVIQPSSLYDHSVAPYDYMSEEQRNGILLEWNGHDITVKTVS